MTSSKEAPMSSSSHRPVRVGGPDAPVSRVPAGMSFERLVFVSGQGAIDPETGTLVGQDIEAQTEQVLSNVQRILEAAGSSLNHVLRCGIFLMDMGELPRMNAVYERRFAGHRPARTTLQAAALPLPGMRVEIDAIAYIP
jgi:2-iminobutanoate/2-iminopropanoate deaminase